MASRQTAYIEYGDPDGSPVIYCHGFPSSSREARFLHVAGLAEHARIIAPDRPGYGGSDHKPGRTIADWAQDVRVLADRLELGRFAVLGVSGGGPYALACAWRLPERLSGCTLVCPLGPIYMKPILAQMSRSTRINFSLARQAPLFSEILLGPLTASVLSSWPRIVSRIRRLNATDADLAELANPGTEQLLDQAIAGAMRRGARGARQDLLLYVGDWGIPVEQIGLEIDIWHGEADRIVPVSHSRWYETHLRNARIRYVPGEGHYSLPMCHTGEILGSLMARVRYQDTSGQEGRSA